MDAVVIGSIGAIILSIVVLVGFVWYWVREIMHHPTTHD